MADEKQTLHNTLNAPSEAAAKAAVAGRADAAGTAGVPETPDKRWGVEQCCFR